MSAPLIALLLSFACAIFTVVWSIFGKGRDVGRFEEKVSNLKDDVQHLNEALSVNNDMHNDSLRELQNEVKNFRLKVAAKLGINGSDH